MGRVDVGVGVGGTAVGVGVGVGDGPTKVGVGVGVGASWYVAVYVWSVAGTVIVWLAARPSDQETKLYPDWVRGESIVCWKLMSVSLTKGVVTSVCWSKLSLRPEGTVAKVRLTFVE